MLNTIFLPFIIDWGNEKGIESLEQNQIFKTQYL